MELKNKNPPHTLVLCTALSGLNQKNRVCGNMKNITLKKSQHSFLNEKWWHTSLRVSEDVRKYVDKGDEVNAISLGFSKGIGPSSKAEKVKLGEAEGHHLSK